MRNQQTIDWLLSTDAIRTRCGALFSLGERDELPHFSLSLDRLDAAAEFVLESIRENYPDFDIPYHSRWRHFMAGGVDRWGNLSHKLSVDAEELARVRIDLAVTSVLLDAGAGENWRYSEAGTGKRFSRSEGLAVASFRMFAAGAFSSDPDNPLCADADSLANMRESMLAEWFQVSQNNPLVGLNGRASLLQALGKALQSQPKRFGERDPRIGNLFDALAKRGRHSQIEATAILDEVLRGFGSVWPDGAALDGHPLGDVGYHSAIRASDASSGLVPFHKLSQWLSYSLVEPLEEAGIEVTGLNALTGLPEYRNGGLFIDMGVLRPKSEELLSEPQDIKSEAIVEWRALTVVLLDRLAERIRESLNMDEAQLPLAKVLEGGTWSAGRKIARQLRPGGPPPIRLRSTGTVF